jgi:hypothetical protein
MKTGTLNQYLNLAAAAPSDLPSRRHLARQTWHTISQCLADGGYPGRCLETFPALGPIRRQTQATLTQWWSSFRACLRTLTVRERRCLSREVVILPEPLPTPARKPAARKTVRTGRAGSISAARSPRRNSASAEV